MTIYAIFEDNGQSWEDHYYGIMEEEIYLDKEEANKMCIMLNNPQFIPPTNEEYIQSYEFDQGITYEEYIRQLKEEFDNPYYQRSYKVKELQVT